jgi:iron complex outermembrane receptor protein
VQHHCSYERASDRKSLLAALGPRSRSSAPRAAIIGAVAPLALALAAAITCPRPAAGQTTPAASDSTSIEQITVVASRLKQQFQDTPVSAVSVSGTEIDDQHVQQAVDLAHVAAGLTANNMTSSGTLQFAVRGVGVDTFSANTPSGIGTFIDGVYQSLPVFLAAPLFDVGDVTVFKGPQGTQFGGDTTGGAVSLASRPPPSTFGGYMSLGYSTWETIDADAAVGGPITSALRYRLAATLTDSREGFQHDIDTGARYGAPRRAALRGQLAFDPTDQLSFLVITNYTHDWSIPESPQTIGTEAATTAAYGLPGLTYPNYLGTPIGGRLDGVDDPTKVRTGGLPLHLFSDSGGVTVQSNYKGSMFKIESITNYELSKGSTIDNFDALPVAATDIYSKTSASQYSEELSLSNVAPEFLDWKIGGFYERTHLQQDITADYSFVYTASYTDHSVLDVSQYAQTLQNYAAYTSATAHLTDRLNLTVGGRYSDYTLDWNGVALDPSGIITGGAPGSVIAVLDEQLKMSYLSYRAALDYKFNDNVLPYISFATGFKPGTIFPPPVAIQAAIGYTKPESVKDLEVGVKSRFWGDRGTFNIAYFHSDFIDRQTLVLETVNNVIAATLSNLPRSKIDGGEIEATLRPVDNFSLHGSVTYQRGIVESLIPDVRGYPVLGPALGSELPMSPELTFVVGGDHDWRLSEVYKLRSGATFSYTGSQLVVAGDPLGNTSVIKDLGLDLSLINTQQTYSVSLWARNALNGAGIVYGATGFLPGHYVYLQHPATYGIRLRHEF